GRPEHTRWRRLLSLPPQMGSLGPEWAGRPVVVSIAQTTSREDVAETSTEAGPPPGRPCRQTGLGSRVQGAEAKPRPYLPPSPSPGFWARTQKFTWRGGPCGSGTLANCHGPPRQLQRFVRTRVAPSMSSTSLVHL